jgi:hypothetical protein
MTSKGKWEACIIVDSKAISLGQFDTVEEAIEAREKAIQKLINEENENYEII